MSGCRVNVPMLRQWKIEPVGKEEGSPLRITIDLQDEVMDQLRVLVQNDRLLTPEAQRAPIPVIETGETTRRFVALESAGRDEVVVDEKTLVGMELLEPQTRRMADAAEHPRRRHHPGVPRRARAKSSRGWSSRRASARPSRPPGRRSDWPRPT